MGYLYNGRARRCDQCGKPGDTRLRRCTATVRYPQDGEAASLPYCKPPALCAPCFKALGGSRALHAACQEPAARRTEANEALCILLAAGDRQVRSGRYLRDGTVRISTRALAPYVPIDYVVDADEYGRAFESASRRGYGVMLSDLPSARNVLGN